MKKILIVISIIVLSLTTGCTAVRIDTQNIDTIVSVVLSKNNTLYNRIGKGYKYYIPRGVTYIDTNDLNDKLYSNGNYYYLYIDAVNYFYKSSVEYTENKDSYYSRKIDDEKNGYLEINQVGDKYLINFVYNYAKIEALVEEKDINEVVLNSSYILSTVKFNDNVIKLMLNEEYFTNKEEKYEEFSKKEEETETENKNHLQYDENIQENIEESEN